MRARCAYFEGQVHEGQLNSSITSLMSASCRYGVSLPAP